MTCELTYPEIDVSKLSFPSVNTEIGDAELVGTTVFLIGAPSEAKAKQVLSAVGKKFPDTLNVDLCWLTAPVTTEKPSATESLALMGERTWAKLNTADNLFESIASPNTSRHNVFMLFYSKNNSEDPTVICNELVRSGFSEHLHPNAMIFPVADYLIDPTTKGGKQIPVSKEGPLAEVEIDGKSRHIPYLVSQIHLVPLEQMLAKGTSKDTLGQRNSGMSLLVILLLIVGALLAPIVLIAVMMVLVSHTVIPLLHWLDRHDWM